MDMMCIDSEDMNLLALQRMKRVREKCWII